MPASAPIQEKQPQSRSNLNWPVWLGLLGLGVLALVLRLWNIGGPGYWQDEIWSVNISRVSLGEMFDLLQGSDLQPPLYYFLLRLYINLGQGEFTVRLLSTLLDLLVLVPLFGFARKMTGSIWSGWFACLLFSLSSLHIIWAQTARMYTLLCLLLLLSIYSFWKLMSEEHPSRWLWAGYILSTAAALYTHNLTVLYLAAQGLAWLLLFRRKELFFRALAGWAIVVVLWLPYIYLFITQAANPTYFDKPNPLQLFDTFLAFAGADQARNGLPFALLALYQPYFLLALVALTWLGLRALREKKTERAYLLIFWLFPLLACWVISQVKPVYADRAFMASGLCFLVIMGAAFRNFSLKQEGANRQQQVRVYGTLVAGVLVVVMAIATTLVLFNGGFVRDQLRELGQDASAYLSQDKGANATLYQFNGNSPVIYNFYMAPSAPRNLEKFDPNLMKSPGRVCVIASNTTKDISYAQAELDKFQKWLQSVPGAKLELDKQYPDENIQMRCWAY